jgi:hypothetical protein
MSRFYSISKTGVRQNSAFQFPEGEWEKLTQKVIFDKKMNKVIIKKCV